LLLLNQNFPDMWLRIVVIIFSFQNQIYIYCNQNHIDE
jgi:hypothetical protein